MKVTGAEIKDGLLCIDLVREIPEEAKPRMIPIKGVEGNGSKGAKVLEGQSKKKTN